MERWLQRKVQSSYCVENMMSLILIICIAELRQSEGRPSLFRNEDYTSTLSRVVRVETRAAPKKRYKAIAVIHICNTRWEQGRGHTKYRNSEVHRLAFSHVRDRLVRTLVYNDHSQLYHNSVQASDRLALDERCLICYSWLIPAGLLQDMRFTNTYLSSRRWSTMVIRPHTVRMLSSPQVPMR